MATATYVGGPPTSGNDLRIGPYECEVDAEISFEEYVAPFLIPLLIGEHVITSLTNLLPSSSSPYLSKITSASLI